MARNVMQLRVQDLLKESVWKNRNKRGRYEINQFAESQIEKGSF